MKIIERHDLHWDRRITCTRCRSILGLELNDVQYKPGDGVQHDYSPEQFYVTCAVCDQRLAVSDLPGWAKEQIRLHRNTVRPRTHQYR